MYRTCRTCLRRGAGIVGLPNVGKSTLFNAMTGSQQAKTGNYPFCTIDANLAKVGVYDPRLRELAKFTGAEKIVDVEIDLADVAGLIAGASKGAGLGNKFLADIRPVTVILHMVRCFESAKDGFDTPNPIDDVRTIMDELILADMGAVEKKILKLRNRGKGDKEVQFHQRLLEWLEEGKLAKDATFITKGSKQDREWAKELGLLSAKPTLYVLNVDDNTMESGNDYSKAMEDKFGVDNTCRVCSVIEEQCAQFTREERLDFLNEYGVKTPATDILLNKAFDLLKLQSYFTVGPKMAHGWAVPKGTTSKDAAGEIHGAFSKNFVAAHVTPWDKYISHPNYKIADTKLKKVDKFYEMEDGDVMVVDHSTEK